MAREATRRAYFRNFIFGVEDSLVSTVGLLSGVAIAGVSRETIFLTGIILVFVEAFSMAAGSFLSEASAEEFDRPRKRPTDKSLVSGGIMLISYFVSGFVPLFPYLFFTVDIAFKISIAASLIALFILGSVSGRLSRANPWRIGARMLLVGGVAIAVGIFVGRFFHAL